MPYSNQYSNAVQELNKCVQLFIHQQLPARPDTSLVDKKKKPAKKTAATDSADARSSEPAVEVRGK